MLDVLPLHELTRNCIEDCIVSIAVWINRGYELLFAESWGFRFLCEKKDNSKLIGSRIIANQAGIKSCLEKYYGILSNYNNIYDSESFIGIIKVELVNERPVIMFIDSFWCPWDGGYRKYHVPHAIISIGFDDKNNCIHCTDAFAMKYDVILPYEDYLRGFSGTYITFSLKDTYLKDISWRDILTNTLNNLNANINNFNAFNEIRKFANAVRLMDLTLEFPSGKSLWSQPLYNNVKNVVNIRWQVINILNYLYEIFNIEELKKLSDIMKQVVSKWTIILSMFVKASFKINSKKLLFKISEKLFNIADAEESFSNDLYEFISVDNSVNKNFSNKLNNKLLLNGVLEKLVYLDLCKNRNNRGFQYNDTNNLVDFTGLNEYFLSDNIFETVNWTLTI